MITIAQLKPDDLFRFKENGTKYKFVMAESTQDGMSWYQYIDLEKSKFIRINLYPHTKVVYEQ